MKYWQHEVIQFVAMAGLWIIAGRNGWDNAGLMVLFMVFMVSNSVSNYSQGLNRGIKIVIDWAKDK